MLPDPPRVLPEPPQLFFSELLKKPPPAAWLLQVPHAAPASAVGQEEVEVGGIGIKKRSAVFWGVFKTLGGSKTLLI